LQTSVKTAPLSTRLYTFVIKYIFKYTEYISSENLCESVPATILKLFVLLGQLLSPRCQQNANKNTMKKHHVKVLPFRCYGNAHLSWQDNNNNWWWR